MINVMIANDLSSYKLGKSDGITFKDVTQEDLKQLKKFAEKYNKQINIIELTDISSSIESNDVIEDKRKVKKIFITNGKETIKITPDKLPEYMQKGYRAGRKSK